jgi:peptide/nickel transport system substrate-binding protein
VVHVRRASSTTAADTRLIWREHQLSHTEDTLLRYLFGHQAEVKTAEVLFRVVWPDDQVDRYGLRADQKDRLRRLVYQLRNHVEPVPRNPRYVCTAHGAGAVPRRRINAPMKPRLFKIWSRRLVLPLTLAWLSITLGWLVGHSEGLAGRPLVIVWGYEPGNYDPHHTSHPVAQSVFRHVCEPLFYEDFDGVVHGLLAEDPVEYGDGGRRLTVRLRSGITFHDGTELDARAVKSSFERLQRLGASPLLNDLREVVVAAQPDGRSVVFTLPEPNYEFVRLVLSNPYAVIVSPQTNDSVELGFVACTGPYRFAPGLYRSGRSLTLVRYSKYCWPPIYFANRNLAHIPQICFHFEADRADRLNELLNGEGCVLSLSREQVTPVATLPRFRLYEATGGVTYLGVNFQRPRWQNVQVRQAVALALDKTALAELGPFLVADTPLTSNATGYDSRAAAFGYDYDPVLSRSLLDRADFDADAEVVLLIPESNTYRELVAVVQQQLQAVGLSQIRVREAPRADILTQRQDFDLLLFDYAWGDYTALGIFLGSGPRNLLNYSGGDIASLVARARTTEDLDLRQQFVLEAQRIVLEQALWQPLLVRQITFAVDGDCVAGERQHPLDEYLLYHDADTR